MSKNGYGKIPRSQQHVIDREYDRIAIACLIRRHENKDVMEKFQRRFEKTLNFPHHAPAK